MSDDPLDGLHTHFGFAELRALQHQRHPRTQDQQARDRRSGMSESRPLARGCQRSGKPLRMRAKEDG